MIKKLLLICLTLGTVVALSSCDDCRGIFGKEKVECHNGGTCNNGECDCLKGYYGTNCESIDVCELRDIVCVYGDCDEGICYCSPGFEGDDCSIETRQRYLGIYDLTESCAELDTITTHQITIEENLLDPSQMYMVNLFNYVQFPITGFFSKVYAVPTAGSDKFSIPSQEPDGNGRRISGSGSITEVDSTNIQLNIDYRITMTSGKVYDCTVQANLANP